MRQPVRLPTFGHTGVLLGVLLLAAHAASAQDSDIEHRVLTALDAASSYSDPAQYIAAARLFIDDPSLVVRGVRSKGPRIEEFAQRWNNPRFLANAQATFESARRDRTLCPAIVGGQPEANITDCVALGTGSEWNGSGVLVSENVVLTAGHLPRRHPLRMAWVGQEIGKKGEPRPLDDSRTEFHRDFRAGKGVDLAIVVLRRPLNMKVRQRANSDETTEAPNLLVVGYGHTTPNGTGVFDQRRSTLMVVSSNPCRSHDEARFCCRSGIEILAGSATQTTCYGDSGGPALVGAKLAGIVRAAATCDDNVSSCDMASTLVRTAEHEQWIVEMIKKNQP